MAFRVLKGLGLIVLACGIGAVLYFSRVNELHQPDLTGQSVPPGDIDGGDTGDMSDIGMGDIGDMGDIAMDGGDIGDNSGQQGGDISDLGDNGAIGMGDIGDMGDIAVDGGDMGQQGDDIGDNSGQQGGNIGGDGDQNGGDFGQQGGNLGGDLGDLGDQGDFGVANNGGDIGQQGGDIGNNGGQQGGNNGGIGDQGDFGVANNGGDIGDNGGQQGGNVGGNNGGNGGIGGGGGTSRFFCGDGICSRNETVASCSDDCGGGCSEGETLTVQSYRSISLKGLGLTPKASDEGFGEALAFIGDVNKDGTSDIAIAGGTSTSPNGSVFIATLGSNGSVSGASEMRSPEQGSLFGRSITGLGDLNGDNIPDIAIGARNRSTGVELDVIHVVLLRQDLSVLGERLIRSGDNSELIGALGNARNVHMLGRSALEGLGDMNQDGIADLATIMKLDSFTGTDQASLAILFLDTNGRISHATNNIMNTQSLFGLTSTQVAESTRIARIGDLNRDGVTDLAMVNPLSDNGKGRLVVVFLDSSGLVQSAKTVDTRTALPRRTVPRNLGDAYGIGDMNGDSIPDILVGSKQGPAVAGGPIEADGATILLMNRNGSVQSSVHVSDELAEKNAIFRTQSFGVALSGLGDLNNNQTADVVIGRITSGLQAQGDEAIATVLLGCKAAVQQNCGDGVITGDEQCDDGNTIFGDGCSSQCEREEGFTCTGAPSICTAICGDGAIRSSERCDDGNTTTGDGCSDRCSIERGFQCSGTPSSCSSICGDGIIVGLEACDDSNRVAGDGCNTRCAVEANCTCFGEPSLCQCQGGTTGGFGTTGGLGGVGDTGDFGIATTGGLGGFGATGLDDTDVSDGTKTNSLALPTGLSDQGSATCGDGLVRGLEGCDDGNLLPQDGCSETCQREFGFSCSGEPSICYEALPDDIAGEIPNEFLKPASVEPPEEEEEVIREPTETEIFADFRVALTGPTRAVEGETITVTVTVINNGPDASLWTVTIPVPEELVFTPLSSLGAQLLTVDPCTLQGTDLVCTAPDALSAVPGSNYAIFDTRFTVTAAATEIELSANIAAGDGTDPIESNNESTPIAVAIQEAIVENEPILPVCGNGIIEGNEECDQGTSNSDSAPDRCRSLCILPACGDGVHDSNEECDDGNQFPSDGCSAFCLIEEIEEEELNLELAQEPVCGNGIQEEGEECDLGDGNKDDPEGVCYGDCTLPTCGDGIINRGIGEACDDGNTNPGDGCDNHCLEETGIAPAIQRAQPKPQSISFPMPNPIANPIPQIPNLRPLSYQLPLAQLAPLATNRAPVGDTGPAAVAVTCAGAAAGYSWLRKKKRK